MKFYEVHYPYYALLKAKTPGEAIKLYVSGVCEDDGSLGEEIKEVDRDYALALYARFSKAEDGKHIPISQAIENFQSDEPMVLLIDWALR